MEIQTITSGDKYYVLHNDTATFAINVIDQVYESNPFPRESVRISADTGASNETRLLTNDVSIKFKWQHNYIISINFNRIGCQF